MVKSFLIKRAKLRLRQFYSDIDTPPILDAEEYFPAYRALEAMAPDLAREALEVFNSNPNVPRFHDILKTQHRISASDGKNWRIFMVKSYGHLIRSNAAQTPILTKVLADLPQVKTATLSYLDPGKHIPRHTGPFRGILRYHLCLYAPDCGTDTPPWLAVDDVRIPYAEGKGLLWDDTYMHEVLNPGPNPRIALLLDIQRPVTRLSHRLAFRMMMAGGRIHSVLREGRMRV